MKQQIFFIIILIALSTSCDSNKSKESEVNEIITSIEPVKNNILMPSDDEILNAIYMENYEYQMCSIVGKQKISENEYHVYIHLGNEVRYEYFQLIHLDTDIWLIRKAGYFARIVTKIDSRNRKTSEDPANAVVVDTVEISGD